jgi:tetratricopeptide (TPR) repeat protein
MQSTVVLLLLGIWTQVVPVAAAPPRIPPSFAVQPSRGPLPGEGEVSAERVAKLQKIIDRISARPETDWSVADRLALSDAYRELGNTTLAVKNADAAVKADPKNPDCWVALIKSQILLRHEVVSAEENFQYAIKAFPNLEKVNELRKDLFFGQIKYGQPIVAANHLAAFVKFETDRLARSPEKESAFLQDAQDLVKTFGERRSPRIALVRLQQRLEVIRREAPEALRPKFDPLMEQLNKEIQAAAAREESPRE